MNTREAPPVPVAPPRRPRGRPPPWPRSLFVAAALVFQPWKLFVDQQVAEAWPPGRGGGRAPPRLRTAEPVVIARGRFISHEHTTTGSAAVLQLPDGSQVLRVEDLRTSNGPLLKVWLSNAPVIEGPDGWHVFDDGRYVDLGELKGNIGSSNYPMPAGVDLRSCPA